MNIETSEAALREARQNEEAAFKAAVEALSEAAYRKARRIHAEIALYQARGSKDAFKESYNETVILTAVANREASKIVRDALHVGWLSRKGII